MSQSSGLTWNLRKQWKYDVNKNEHVMWKRNASIGITFEASQTCFVDSRGTELTVLPFLPQFLWRAARAEPGTCTLLTSLAEAGVRGKCWCHWLRGVSKAFPSSAIKSLLLKHFPWFQVGSIAVHTTYALHADTSRTLWNTATGQRAVIRLQVYQWAAIKRNEIGNNAEYLTQNAVIHITKKLW